MLVIFLRCVSTSNSSSWTETLIDFRIQTLFNSISHPRNNPPSGVPFPPLKSCSRHGRRNVTHPSSTSTRTRFLTASRSFESTISGLTKSPASYWHLVRFFLLCFRRSLLTKPLQFCIRITSLLTSNSHGAGQRSKRPKSQKGISRRRTGMTRLDKLWKIL
jgi:hypothetical protein